MADVKICELPESVIATFRVRAAAAGRSMEEELRLQLIEAASRPRQDMLAELDAFREMLQRKYGILSDSTEGMCRPIGSNRSGQRRLLPCDPADARSSSTHFPTQPRRRTITECLTLRGYRRDG